jgi:hypothetical protein
VLNIFLCGLVRERGRFMGRGLKGSSNVGIVLIRMIIGGDRGFLWDLLHDFFHQYS